MPIRSAGGWRCRTNERKESGGQSLGLRGTRATASSSTFVRRSTCPTSRPSRCSPHFLAVRATDVTAAAAAIRRAVAEKEPGGGVLTVSPLPRLLAAPLARPRFQSALVTSFAAIGFVLSLIGTYGVLAFFVRQRTREIGIRIALGATPSRVRVFVLRHALMIGIVGVLVGLAGATMVGRLVQPLLFGVTATDPLVLSSTGLALLVAIVAATLGPTRSATRTNPLLVLRGE